MARSQFMYEAEIRHDGLHKYRLIRGKDRYVVQQQAAAQRAQVVSGVEEGAPTTQREPDNSQ